MTNSCSRLLGGPKAWIVCLTASLFFFYAFLQMGILNSLGEPMMRDLGIQAGGLAALSSAYFYANILFLFPAGILLDRFSSRRIMLLSIVTMILSVLIFSLTSSFILAMVCRFAFGIAGSFCLLSNVSLATRWFPAQKLALVIGVIVMVGMAGGMVAQTPFILLSDALGWRACFQVDALLGLLIFALVYMLVKDHPAGIAQANHTRPPFLPSIKKVIANGQNWLAGLYASLMNIPVMIFIVFGSLYLVQAESLPRTDASLLMTVFLLGAILGSPAFGYISDKLGSRKTPMLIAPLLAVALTWPLLHGHFSEATLGAVFLLLGFLTSAQVISFPLIAQNNPPELTGTAEGMGSVLIMSSGLASSIFAYLLGPAQLIHQVAHYSLPGFHHALLIMPITFSLAFLCACALRKERKTAPTAEQITATETT